MKKDKKSLLKVNLILEYYKNENANYLVQLDLFDKSEV